MMHQLVYSSSAKSNLSSENIAEILKAARDFNSKNDITGCLLYYNHEFIQILEGDEKVIKNLYFKIEKDDRHSNIKLLAEGAAEKKIFAKWSMAFYEPEKDDIKDMGKEMFIDNFITFSELSQKSTFPSILFWNKAYRLLQK